MAKKLTPRVTRQLDDLDRTLALDARLRHAAQAAALPPVVLVISEKDHNRLKKRHAPRVPTPSAAELARAKQALLERIERGNRDRHRNYMLYSAVRRLAKEFEDLRVKDLRAFWPRGARRMLLLVKICEYLDANPPRAGKSRAPTRTIARALGVKAPTIATAMKTLAMLADPKTTKVAVPNSVRQTLIRLGF